MAPVKLCVSLRDYPKGIQAHLVKRISERGVSKQAADEMNAWLKTKPDVPDLNEAPDGWYKPLPSCIVLGEGEHIKTIFTLTQVPRKGSVNLDTWKAS